MRLAFFGSQRTRKSCSLALSGLAIMGLLVGCPTVVPPDDNGNGNSNGNGNTSTDAEIVSPSTNFGISVLEPPVSVLYTVDTTATDIRGYYVPVAGAGVDSAEIGSRVVTASNLDPGVRQAFSFDPAEAGVGYFRVGILYSLGSSTGETAESRAVIQVQGPPDPIFILPPDDINEVVKGDAVAITFDIRDPDGIAQWRLFWFVPLAPLDGPADELGTEIASGSGNVGSAMLRTEDLALGDYQLGISATDSGRTIAGTVDAGESSRIVTIPSDGSVTPIIRIVAAP